MRLNWALAGAILLSSLPATALASGADHCSGDTPAFRRGFLALAQDLGDVMGQATTCEYVDPNGTGDTEQNTSTGLAYWRKATNRTTFFDGLTHYALSADGVLQWDGDSPDAPTLAVAPENQPAPPPPALVSLAPVPAPAPVVVAPAPPPAPAPAPVLNPPYTNAPGDVLYIVRPAYSWLFVDGRGTQLAIDTALAAIDANATVNLVKDLFTGAVKHLGADVQVQKLEDSGYYSTHVRVLNGSNAGLTGSMPNKAFH